MPKAKPTQVIVHRIEFNTKERQYLEQYVAGQTVKNVIAPLTGVAFVGSASYLTYKALKAAFDWGTDLPQELWDKTILSAENRRKWRESASQPENSPYSGEGPSQGELLARTFHFWTGGIFADDTPPKSSGGGGGF